MKKLWYLTIALVLILAALSVPAATAEEEPTQYTSGDYRYTLQPDETATIAKYTGSASELSIPDTLDGHAVTAIGDKAFASCRFLMSVTIPDGVTAIGDSAFRWCDSLTSVTIPERVTTIGDSAFSACDSLTSVTIPDGVIEMGGNPFRGCDNLTQIMVSPDNPVFETIDGVLFNKSEKKLVCYPYAFTQTSYTIPDGIRFIGNGAFSSCHSLTSITIPNSVTSIGGNAFDS